MGTDSIDLSKPGSGRVSCWPGEAGRLAHSPQGIRFPGVVTRTNPTRIQPQMRAGVTAKFEAKIRRSTGPN